MRLNAAGIFVSGPKKQKRNRGVERGSTEIEYAARGAARNNAAICAYHFFAYLKASKDISAGEEICVGYGWEYWREHAVRRK